MFSYRKGYHRKGPFGSRLRTYSISHGGYRSRSKRAADQTLESIAASDPAVGAPAPKRLRRADAGSSAGRIAAAAADAVNSVISVAQRNAAVLTNHPAIVSQVSNMAREVLGETRELPAVVLQGIAGNMITQMASGMSMQDAASDTMSRLSGFVRAYGQLAYSRAAALGAQFLTNFRMINPRRRLEM